MRLNLSAVRTTHAEIDRHRGPDDRTHSGEGFFEITGEVAQFLKESKARDGGLPLFLRHTSASLVIQENADPDVRRDLSPRSAAWRRPMPAGFTMSRDRTICRLTSNPWSTAFRSMSRSLAARQSRHLAGHLCRRTPPAPAPARGDAAIYRVGVDFRWSHDRLRKPSFPLGSSPRAGFLRARSSRSRR